MFEQGITFLHTADLEKATHFYRDLLGLPLALDQGACRIFQSAQGAYIGFCQKDSIIPPTSQVILTLVTQDVDDWYARLTAAGVGFEKIPQYNSRFRIYHCFLRDPDGYLLEIQRFEDDAWQSG